MCGTKLNSKCTTAAIPSTGLLPQGAANATGTYCYCEGDLCNSARILEPTAGGASDGRVVLSFAASLSLLALAGGRFLGG